VHFIKTDQLPSCAKTGCPVVVGVVLALTDSKREVSLTLFVDVGGQCQT
jgi:hypothetical protein